MFVGDLTDARRSKYDTDQYMEEWQSYHNIIKETGVADNRPWLDLPGNHGELHMYVHMGAYVHVYVYMYCFKIIRKAPIP